MGPSENRLSALDGLRGVAILLVMGFHYFNSDPNLYPVGDALASILLFKYGFLGVELFFIISGFVIALTLEKCKTPFEFLIRRFARLWPPLLVCSILTFLIVRYSGSPFSAIKTQGLANFLPSLTFTTGSLWSAFPSADLIDTAYWTLIAEVRFYIIAAVIFWTLPKERLALNLVIFTYASILIRAALQRALPGSNVIYTSILIPDFMPWFAAGAIFYDLHMKRTSASRAAILLISMFAITARTSAFTTDPSLSPLMTSLIGAAFFGVFWLFATTPQRVSVLKAKWLVFVGMCSYSIYLLHYGIGMTLISSVPPGSVAFGIAMEIVVILAMIGAGYLSFLFIEGPGRKVVMRIASRRSVTVQVGTPEPPTQQAV